MKYWGEPPIRGPAHGLILPPRHLEIPRPAPVAPVSTVCPEFQNITRFLLAVKPAPLYHCPKAAWTRSCFLQPQHLSWCLGAGWGTRTRDGTAVLPSKQLKVLLQPQKPFQLAGISPSFLFVSLLQVLQSLLFIPTAISNFRSSPFFVHLLSWSEH